MQCHTSFFFENYEICQKICLHNNFTKYEDPDQMATEKPADLDLHCFQNMKYPGVAWL